MKKIKKLLTIGLTVLLMLCMSISLSACKKNKYSTETDPSKYLGFELLEDGTYQVNGFVDLPVLHLVIPSTYNNIPVTKIRRRAFMPSRGIWGGIYTAPIESVVIEEGITIIEENAFSVCRANSFILPDSLTYVANEAFAENGNYTINYPKNLEYIGTRAFFGANFTEDIIEIDGVELNWGAFSGANIKKVIFLSDYQELREEIFYNCIKLEEVVLPNSLECIPQEMFYGCVALQNIAFGENIKEIGGKAFYSCETLKEVIIGKNIQRVGAYAFSNSGLEKVSFGGEYITLETSAFNNCKNLNKLELNDVRINGLAQAFTNSPLNNITLSANSRYQLLDGAICEEKNEEITLLLGRSAFNSFDKIDYIGDYAFAYCIFDELIIPDNVIKLKPNSFMYAKIENLSVSAKEIGTKAFYYATIKSADVFSEFIGVSAFEDVKELKILNLKNGCREIRTNAFCCLFDLEKVYISETVEKIETAAFIQCHSLKDVYYLKKDTPIVDLHAGTFIIYISNILTEDHRIKATINDDFKIHVNNEIYDECINLWSDMQADNKYIYHKSLKEHIVKE